ncbi:MAG: AsmA family protein [Bdellovibrionales bacterium]
MKRFLQAFVVLILLAGGVVVALPSFIDVDKKLRPEIERIVKQSIDAEFELGKMELSLWKGISVKIAGLRIRPTGASEDVFVVEQASLNAPYSAIFGGDIRVDLVANQPNVNIVKTKDGAFNFEKLFAKESAEKPSVPGKHPNSTGESSDLQFLDRLNFNLQLLGSSLSFRDNVGGINSNLTGLDFDLKNVGFNKPIQIALNSDVVAKVGSDIQIDGSISTMGEIEIEWANGFNGLIYDLGIDLTDLGARVNGVVNKKKSIPLTAEADGVFSKSKLRLNNLAFVVDGFKLNIVGDVINFKSPKLNIDASSNNLKIQDWVAMLPMLQDYNPSGDLRFNLKATGPISKVSYSAQTGLSGFSAIVPGIRKPLTQAGIDLSIVNDKLSLNRMTGVLGSSNFNITGDLKDFDKPNISIALSSKNIDMDDIVAPKTKAEIKQAKEQAKKAKPEITDEEIEQLLLGPVDTIKSNPLFAKIRLGANIKVDRLKVDKLIAENFYAKANLKSLVLRLNQARLEAFNGKANLTTAIDIRPKTPKYDINAEIESIDVDNVIGTFMPKLKGSMIGRLNADFNLNGSGVRKTDLKKNLAGVGGFKVVDGKWSGLSAMKMIGEKLSKVKGAAKEAAKVRIGNEFTRFEGKFSVVKGKLVLNTFIMDLKEARTAVSGSGHIDFDQNIDITAYILAPANKDTPKKMLSKDGRASFPIEIGGTLSNPKVFWEKTLKKVAGAYVEAEVKKSAEKQIKKEVNKLLDSKKAKDFLKKLNF